MSTEEILISDLTQSKLDGDGVFDVLMRATKAHLDREHQQHRITGPEYSTVYLGSIQQVMQTSLEFLIQRKRIALEESLLEQQVLLTAAQVAHTQAQVDIAVIQKDIALAELDIAQANAMKIPAEIQHIEAQTALVEANTSKVPAEKAHIEAQTELVEANLTKVPAEKEQIETQTRLIDQQHTNAVTENLVLQAQKCKLDAEFDLIGQNVLKAGAEIGLLGQKTVTERAQVSTMGVDEDSIIGRQKRLYMAQTDGFQRDAEQKAAKILVDTWGIQRSTDEGTPANSTNMLDDASVGRVVRKMLDGVQA